MKSRGYVGTPKKIVTISNEECETPKKKLKFNGHSSNGSRSLFKELMTFKMNQNSTLLENSEQLPSDASASTMSSPKSLPLSPSIGKF